MLLSKISTDFSDVNVAFFNIIMIQDKNKFKNYKTFLDFIYSVFPEISQFEKCTANLKKKIVE